MILVLGGGRIAPLADLGASAGTEVLLVTLAVLLMGTIGVMLLLGPLETAGPGKIFPG